MLTVTRHDCKWSYHRTGGHGGQHRDKTSNGVRVVHPPSGARGQASESRSQAENKRTAFGRMAETSEFKAWVRLEHARRIGAIDQAVKDALRSENILIEYGPFSEALEEA